MEIYRVLRPEGSLQVADWGLPSNALMRACSWVVQKLDGVATTADSFAGLLPKYMEETGFVKVKESNHFNTLFGTLRLYQARKL